MISPSRRIISMRSRCGEWIMTKVVGPGCKESQVFYISGIFWAKNLYDTIYCMDYEAVIFDLFGTLVYNVSTDISNEVLKEMAEVLAVQSDDFIRLWHSRYKERMTGVFGDYKDCIQDIYRELNLPTHSKLLRHAEGLRKAPFIKCPQRSNNTRVRKNGHFHCRFCKSEFWGLRLA